MTQLYPHYREPLGVPEHEEILVARMSKKDGHLKAAVCFTLNAARPFSVRYTRKDADGSYYATVAFYDILTDAINKFKRAF